MNNLPPLASAFSSAAALAQTAAARPLSSDAPADAAGTQARAGFESLAGHGPVLFGEVEPGARGLNVAQHAERVLGALLAA